MYSLLRIEVLVYFIASIFQSLAGRSECPGDSFAFRCVSTFSQSKSFTNQKRNLSAFCLSPSVDYTALAISFFFTKHPSPENLYFFEFSFLKLIVIALPNKHSEV